MTPNDADELIDPAEPKSLRLVDGTLESPPGDVAAGQVQNGAGWRSDRDAVAAGELIRCEGAAAMVRDTPVATAVLTRDRDVHSAFAEDAERRDLPERRCILVAEHRAVTAGEHRGLPPSPSGEGGRRNEVDTAMNATQPAELLAGAKLLPTEAQFTQLIQRDDSVLLTGECDDRASARPGGLLPAHTTVK